MSAVAIQFDPTLTMGHRLAFTWTGPLESCLSSGNSMVDTSFHSIVSESEASQTPPSETQSLASSPVPETSTTGQLELRRYGERARRDLKLSARIRRVNSSPYSAESPPMTMGDVSTTVSMPLYSSAPLAASLIATPATAMGGQSYLPPYSSSLQDQQHGPQLFAPPYQQPFVLMEYAPGYAGPGEYGTRTPSLPVSQDMYQMAAVATPGNGIIQEGSSRVRVVQSRPKPRCWEHGCNGRQFSTFSNLLRHQREKSGQAAKATCPNCGAEFTRTTARNGHMLHDKCKQRRNTRVAVP